MAKEHQIPMYIDPETLKSSHDQKKKEDIKRHLDGQEIIKSKVERSDLEVQIAFRVEAANLFSREILNGSFDPESLHKLVDALDTEKFGDSELTKKDFDKQIAELKERIKDGFYVDKDVTQYGFIDELSGQLHWYDSDGNYVSSERYKRAQKTIFTKHQQTHQHEGEEQPFADSGLDAAIGE